MPIVRSFAPTPEQMQFYKEAMTAIGAVAARYPNIRNMEVIALLGQALGTAIAMAYPDERDLARATAIENMDQRIAEVADPHAQRPGPQPTDRIT